jgi:hypothetical protein
MRNGRLSGLPSLEARIGSAHAEIVREGEASFTFGGSSVKGKETIRSADSTGDVLSDCTYDITMTKG